MGCVLSLLLKTQVYPETTDGREYYFLYTFPPDHDFVATLPRV